VVTDELPNFRHGLCLSGSANAQTWPVPGRGVLARLSASHLLCFLNNDSTVAATLLSTEGLATSYTIARPKRDGRRRSRVLSRDLSLPLQTRRNLLPAARNTRNGLRADAIRLSAPHPLTTRKEAAPKGRPSYLLLETVDYRARAFSLMRAARPCSARR
jgi:hypothetical protein